MANDQTPTPATQEHVATVTSQQTTALNWSGWIRTAATVAIILLGMLGFKLVPATPTPAPDAAQQIVDVLKAKQQPEWTLENVKAWLDAQSKKGK